MNFERPPTPPEAVRIFNEIASRTAKPAARKVDKPLAIYGAGKLGKMAVELLEHVCIRPEMIVDANPERARIDPFWDERAIIEPSQISLEIRSSYLLAVSIANLPFDELATTLYTQGWKDIVPFYDIAEAYKDRYPLSNGWVLDQLEDADISATQKVLETWNDDISRAHHLQFMAWHRYREDFRFTGAPVTIDDRYLIPEVLETLGDEETFIDAGAHHGEVAERFRAAVYNRYKDAWMIEPDLANAISVEQSISGLHATDQARNHLLNIAVASKSGTSRFFSGLGYASQLSELGSDVVTVKTIDELELAPSFIKLHLEGYELDALMGAESTLRRWRPIITATAYHNELGVWRLPWWLMNLLKDYQYYFRLHSWCGTGAVIYCIPKERIPISDISESTKTRGN